MRKPEIISYPHLGKVYPGDYLEGIPYPEYIREQPIPECNAHGDVGACGLWIRHAENVKLERIRIRPRARNTREWIQLLDVT